MEGINTKVLNEKVLGAFEFVYPYIDFGSKIGKKLMGWTADHNQNITAKLFEIASGDKIDLFP